MESLFGLVGKDFVILAADQSATRSILVYKDDEDKMVQLDDFKVAAGNGPLSDRAEFFEYLQKNMKLYQLRNGITLKGHAAANYMRGEMATMLRSNPKSVNVLLGTVDKEEGGVAPALYWMDYISSLAKVNYGAHGYGAHFCLGIFDRYWKPDLTQEEAVKILRLCRNELDERFLVKNGKWKVKVIDADGTREIAFP